MSFPPIDLDPMLLAARVAKAMSQAHHLAYAQLATDLSVVQFSPNFPALMADRNPDILGRPITDLLWEFVGAEGVLVDVLQGKLPIYRLEHVNREAADGSLIYLNFQVTPLDEAQPERGLLLLAEDTTAYGRLQQNLVQDRNELRLLQRRLAQTNEELSRLNRLKSVFLSMAAHDLRTPLTAIQGYASLMLDRVPAGELSDLCEYLNIVISQSDRLNRLIADFLDLDQIEQGKLAFNYESCDLAEIAREVLDVLRVSIDGRRQQVTLELPEAPIILWADRDKLLRISYNLLGNAIKYTPAGGQIRLRVYRQDGEAVFQVEDKGKGMSREQVGQLFQLYYRTEEVRRGPVHGTGVGLFIVKTMVDGHKGRVEVSSEPGQGSTFTVYLPMTLIPDD